MQVQDRIEPMKRKQPNRLSDQLRRFMENCKLSRYEISKRTGLDEGLLSRFAHKKSGLAMESIDLLGDCLGLELVARRRPRAKKGG